VMRRVGRPPLGAAARRLIAIRIDPQVRANVSSSMGAIAGRGSAPTPANTSLIAAENGAPNGAPLRGQKPSQRVTTHDKALANPK
jgi:hypothetical protein